MMCMERGAISGPVAGAASSWTVAMSDGGTHTRCTGLAAADAGQARVARRRRCWQPPHSLTLGPALPCHACCGPACLLRGTTREPCRRCKSCEQGLPEQGTTGTGGMRRRAAHAQARPAEPPCRPPTRLPPVALPRAAAALRCAVLFASPQLTPWAPASCSTLSDNRLKGQLPASWGGVDSWPAMRYLYMNSNPLGGELGG
mgnify:CR=1 FL=1